MRELQAQLQNIKRVHDATKAALVAARDAKWTECKRLNREAQRLYARVEAQRLMAAQLQWKFDLEGGDAFSQDFLATIKKDLWRLDADERGAQQAQQRSATVAAAAAPAAAPPAGSADPGDASAAPAAGAPGSGRPPVRPAPRRARHVLLRDVRRLYGAAKEAAQQAGARSGDPLTSVSDDESSQVPRSWHNLMHGAAGAVVGTERMLLHQSFSNQMVGRQRAKASRYREKMGLQLAREREEIARHLRAILRAAEGALEGRPGARAEAEAALAAAHAALLAGLAEPVERFSIRLDEPCWTPVLGNGWLGAGGAPARPRREAQGREGPGGVVVTSQI